MSCPSASPPSHIPLNPAILYFGTPVVLISTINPDSTPNIGAMSSCFFLAHSAILGLDSSSATTVNLLRTGECVLNLAASRQTAAVNALAKTTGSDPVPPRKQARGYVHVKDKFGAAGLAPLASQEVSPPGIKQCPVILEAKLTAVHHMFGNTPFKGKTVAIEVEIICVRIHPKLKLEGYKNRIDADVWNPMIMSFCELYGLEKGKLAKSRLAKIDEESYRMPRTGGENGTITGTT